MVGVEEEVFTRENRWWVMEEAGARSKKN